MSQLYLSVPSGLLSTGPRCLTVDAATVLEPWPTGEPPFVGVIAGPGQPVTLTETSDYLFVVQSNPVATILQSHLAGGTFAIESNPNYEGGQGSYATAAGGGYYFSLRVLPGGVTMTLQGLANPNGGTFAVYANNQQIGVADCSAASLTQQVYFTTALAPGDYLIYTEKLTGAAMYMDTITLL